MCWIKLLPTFQTEREVMMFWDFFFFSMVITHIYFPTSNLLYINLSNFIYVIISRKAYHYKMKVQ